MPRSADRTGDNGSNRRTKLRSGLRVVSETIPSVRSVSIGVWVDVGSRNESPHEAGLSHFIEHMVFKGTKRRSAKEIASSLESIGGALNGFTSREQTCYTGRVLDDHLTLAIDVLADLTCNATMTSANMEKERLVICEEIKESLDTPSDHIHDLFSETYWGDDPLGHPIMGSIDNIMGMKRRDMLSYQRRYYKPQNIVVAASGSVSHDRLVRLVREKFDFIAGESPPPLPALRSGSERLKMVSSNGNQTHLYLGYPGVAYGDSQKSAMLILNAHLGGGMSSVLFQKIREQLGLAYAIYTYHDFHRDSGILGAYLGTDKDHLKLALEVIFKEFDRVKKRRIPNSDLDRVKAQIKGQITISLESTSVRMNRLARQELMAGRFTSLKEVFTELDRVTSSDILEIANSTIVDSELAVAILGPADRSEVDAVLNR